MRNFPVLREIALQMVGEAMKVANRATCARSRCGAIIVATDGKVIGRGFNSPPQNREEHRRCHYPKTFYHDRVTDKTCCIHAEQRAIMDALRNYAGKINNSILYFARIDGMGGVSPAGAPYCTICSKMILDVGIAWVVLLRGAGLRFYEAEEYNTLSCQYNQVKS